MGRQPTKLSLMRAGSPSLVDAEYNDLSAKKNIFWGG